MIVVPYYMPTEFQNVLRNMHNTYIKVFCNKCSNILNYSHYRSYNVIDITFITTW